MVAFAEIKFAAALNHLRFLFLSPSFVSVPLYRLLFLFKTDLNRIIIVSSAAFHKNILRVTELQELLPSFYPSKLKIK